MQVNLHLVSPTSVVYTSSISGRSAKSILSMSSMIMLGLFPVSPARMVYTFDEVFRSTLPMSPIVVLKSPSFSDKSNHKYIEVI